MTTIPGKEIACLYDKLGPIRVFDDGNKRYLSFGGDDEQSCMVKANPSLLQHQYNRAMMLVLLFCEAKNIMILGLGGGSLANCLLNRFEDINITIVELRESVIKIASKYFALPQSERLNVINADALNYLSKVEDSQCDVLFSDLFIAEGLEARQLTSQFIENAKRVLTDDGWLVVNCLEEYRTEKVIETLIGRFFSTFYECITDDGNWVIIAGNRPIENPTKQYFFEAKALSSALGFSLLPFLKKLT